MMNHFIIAQFLNCFILGFTHDYSQVLTYIRLVQYSIAEQRNQITVEIVKMVKKTNIKSY